MWTCIIAKWDKHDEDKTTFEVEEFHTKAAAEAHALEAFPSYCHDSARHGLCNDHMHATQRVFLSETTVARIFEGTLSKGELVAAYPKMKWNVGYCDC